MWNSLKLSEEFIEKVLERVMFTINEYASTVIMEFEVNKYNVSIKIYLKPSIPWVFTDCSPY